MSALCGGITEQCHFCLVFKLSALKDVFRMESLFSAQKDAILKKSPRNTPSAAWKCRWKHGASSLHSSFSPSPYCLFFSSSFRHSLPFSPFCISPPFISRYRYSSLLFFISAPALSFFTSLSKEPDVCLLWFIQMQRLRLGVCCRRSALCLSSNGWVYFLPSFLMQIRFPHFYELSWRNCIISMSSSLSHFVNQWLTLQRQKRVTKTDAINFDIWQESIPT